ncbi:hypothetical protein EAI_08927, partial [Harpegnathos saltator]
INIRGHNLLRRLLIMKVKPIILSNVCPIITHQIIFGSLNIMKMNIVSPITFIRAGISELDHDSLLVNL